MQGNKKNNEGKKQSGRWAPDQHERFMAAIATYGKDWKKVQQIVKTRSGSQVRSHAQKFFNKLLKQQHLKYNGDLKLKVPQLREQDQQQSQNENSFAKFLHQDGSNTTPIQLVSLIKGQSLKNNSQKINIKNFQQKIEERLADIEQDNNQDQNLDVLKRQNSLKSMNNILDVYQNLKGHDNNTDLQNQSFLIKLTKQYKKYFGNGGKFQNLIDFGNPIELEQAAKSIRKRSFTLPEGVQGDQQDLNQRKKRLITQQATAKLTPAQKQGFKLLINNLNKKQQNIQPNPASVTPQVNQKKQ